MARRRADAGAAVDPKVGFMRGGECFLVFNYITKV